MMWTGRESPWRGRVEALLRAFAEHAAEIEGTTRELLEGIGKELGGEGG